MLSKLLFTLDYFIWKLNYGTQQETDCKAENLTPQRHTGKQTAEKSKAYLLSKSRSNWKYITILSQQSRPSAESVAEATYANRIWQNSPAMRRLAEVSNFAPFFSESWLDMRVQFRESEIWARCVIAEPGILTVLYLLGRYFLFAQICLYMEFSHVYLESFFTLFFCATPSERAFEYLEIRKETN